MRYRDACPELIRKKFSRLRETATGKRSPVLRSRPKAGLANVYAAANLPSVKAREKLPRGERRMPEEPRLVDFVKEYQPTPPNRKALRTIKSPKQ